MEGKRKKRAATLRIAGLPLFHWTFADEYTFAKKNVYSCRK